MCFKGLRGTNWQEKIGEHRTWFDSLLEDSPSMKSEIPQLIDRLWRSATLDVHKMMRTGFDLMPK